MIQWNDFGVERTADEATYRELMDLRNKVHTFDNQVREIEKRETLKVLREIVSAIKEIKPCAGCQ